MKQAPQNSKETNPNPPEKKKQTMEFLPSPLKTYKHLTSVEVLHHCSIKKKNLPSLKKNWIQGNATVCTLILPVIASHQMNHTFFSNN